MEGPGKKAEEQTRQNWPSIRRLQTLTSAKAAKAAKTGHGLWGTSPFPCLEELEEPPKPPKHPKPPKRVKVGLLAQQALVLLARHGTDLTRELEADDKGHCCSKGVGREANVEMLVQVYRQLRKGGVGF